MEIERKDIHTSRLMFSKYAELAIDDDFNIPDAKKDVESIITQCGNVVLEEVTYEDGKAVVCGTVYFKVLYKTVGEAKEIEVFTGDIPFEDRVNMENVEKGCIECQSRLEDLSVGIINSRKLEVRCLVGNDISIYTKNCIGAVVDVTEKDGVECQYKNTNITETVIAKRDVFRIKEELDIPQSKPNIRELMWPLIALRNMEVKAGEDKLYAHGEVEIFVIYKSDDENLPAQYLYSVRTISKEIPCDKARDGMMLEADVSLGKGDVSVKSNEDGEDRIIAVDYSVDMNIKLYEDKGIDMISDLYSPRMEIMPEFHKVKYENILMRNAAKAKITQRKKINKDGETVLQICHIFGTVEIDDVNIEPDKAEYIDIAGVVKTNILYLCADDDPIKCMQEDIPFTYKVELSKLLNPKNLSVRIVPAIDQLNATLINSEEVEIRAQVNLNISVFECMEEEIITEVEMKPLDSEKKAKSPGIVGYVVKPGDTLWSIARKYYATTESIREINKLENDNIKVGDRLMVVKS